MTATARAIIDLDVTGHVISRHIYGHFAEHLGRCIYDGFWVGEDSPIPNERGIRARRRGGAARPRHPEPSLAGRLLRRQLPLARRHRAAPESRPKIANTNWGDVVENNHFGTHEFMDLCDLLGADAYVNGNVGSGTVQEMARLGRVSDAWRRQPDGTPAARERPRRAVEGPLLGARQRGVGMRRQHVGPSTTPRRHGATRRSAATTATTLSPGSRPVPASDDLNWTRVLMRSLTECLGCTLYGIERVPGGVVPLLHALRVRHEHRGCDRLHGEPVLRTMAKAADIDRVIRGHVAVMDSYDPTGRIGLVCDEWGTWWNVEEGTNPGFLFQQNTMRDALVAGSALRHLPPSRAAAHDGEHRADRERPAGDDAHGRAIASCSRRPITCSR